MQQHDYDDFIHLFNIQKARKMNSLNKELKILNLQFIMLLSKKLQLRVLKAPKELNWYL